MAARKRVCVLISGRGSNLKALIDACRDPDYPAEIALVISNRPEAAGIQHARDAGILATVIDHKFYDTREEFDAALQEAISDCEIDLICNAGFMRLLTDAFVERWKDRQLNIHPSLLPSFKGMNVHERVLEAGARISGCTVHFVRSEMDTGPIIAQAAVPVLIGDTPDSLAARVLKAEHQLYPMALKLVASGSVRVVSERVVSGSSSARQDDDTEPLMSPPLYTDNRG